MRGRLGAGCRTSGRGWAGGLVGRASGGRLGGPSGFAVWLGGSGSVGRAAGSRRRGCGSPLGAARSRCRRRVPGAAGSRPASRRRTPRPTVPTAMARGRAAASSARCCTERDRPRPGARCAGPLARCRSGCRSPAGVRTRRGSAPARRRARRRTRRRRDRSTPTEAPRGAGLGGRRRAPTSGRSRRPAPRSLPRRRGARGGAARRGSAAGFARCGRGVGARGPRRARESEGSGR